MTWNLNTDGDVINVRAVIDTTKQQDEIRELITALEKRLTKENPDGREPADV